MEISDSVVSLSMNWVLTAAYTTKVIQVIQVLFCVQAFLYLQLQYMKACNHFSTQLCTHFEHVCDDTNLNGISLFHETTILCRWQAGGRGGRPQLPNCRGGSRKMEEGWHNRQESYPTSQPQNASESISFQIQAVGQHLLNPTLNCIVLILAHFSPLLLYKNEVSASC